MASVSLEEIMEAFTRENLPKKKSRMDISEPIKIILLLKDQRPWKDLEREEQII